jgi:hypothetical protein
MTQEELSDVPITPLGIGIEGQPAKYRIAKTVNDLAGTLLGDWKHPKDDLWRAAVSACIRAFEAQTNGDAARAAFILAADDAELPLIVHPHNLMATGEARDQKRKMPAWKRRDMRARH